MSRDILELTVRRIARVGGLRLFAAVRQPWLAGLIRWLGSFQPMPPDCKPPIRAVETTQDWFSTNPHGNNSYQTLIPSSVQKRASPRTVGETIHWKFRERIRHQNPEAYLAILEDGAVIGSTGAVMASDRTILGDVSLEWYMPAERHSSLFLPKLPPPTRLPGTTATLALVSGNAYYHWLVDVLPRIELLRRAGTPLESIDQFILNGGNMLFQSETLGGLGIGMDKCVFAERRRHFRAERLLVTSRCGTSGNPPQWVADFLRSAFPAGDRPSKQPSRIYISRRKAKYRRLLNEEDVLARLKKCGFREVTMEGMPFNQQVDLFAGAEAIVAPHGGGLANIVFCRPQTRIVEFFSPHYVNECFWALGNLVDLDYSYLLGKGKRPPEGCDRQWGEWNIKIDLNELDELLRLANLK